MTMENPFVHYIDLLGVKHTKKYSGRVYNEHPFKNSLYAFSSLLFDYGVDNVTIQLLEEDKDIRKLEAPLVISLGFNIAIVSKIENGFVTYTTLNNIKSKSLIDTFNDLIKSLLLKQPYIEVDKSSSQILFGNKKANILITIFTNPHCTPCGRMHHKLKKFLKDANGKLCIQYIFASFGGEYDESSSFMIATYLDKTLNENCRIYHEWFTTGRANRFSFFKKYKDPMDGKCLNEFNKHNEWCEKAKLKATPTVLINGYQLPKNYQIEGIHFFTSIDFSKT